jgi:uncharacterized protein
MSEKAMERLAGLVRDLAYDLCILTGDYRGLTYGPCMDGARGARGI